MMQMTHIAKLLAFRSGRGLETIFGQLLRNEETSPSSKALRRPFGGGKQYQTSSCRGHRPTLRSKCIIGIGSMANWPALL